jgi:cell division protein FtsB
MLWLRRAAVVGCLIALVIALPRGLELGAGAPDLGRVERERSDLVEANLLLREEVRLLTAEVQALQRDPREIERIAREDLNLVRPGERVFELVRTAAPRRPGAQTP